ncbi:hypothetical protein D3C78_1743620 [compost metagenome]
MLDAIQQDSAAAHGARRQGGVEGGLLVHPGWLTAGIFQGVHLAMQDGAAVLHPAIMAAANDLAIVHQHRADRNTPLLEPLAGFVYGGLQESGSALVHGFPR